MTLLLISPSVSPLPGKGSNPSSNAVSPFSADGGDGLEGGVQTLNFGALLSKQLKGLAELLEKKGDPAMPEAADDAALVGDVLIGMPGAVGALLPPDLAALQASLALPNAAKPAERADLASGDAPQVNVADLRLEIPLAENLEEKSAEIADTGKSLPPVLEFDEQFSNTLAQLSETAGSKPELAAVTESTPTMQHQPISGSVDATSALRQPETRPAQQVLPRVGAPEWGGAVGDKMVWMANQNHQVAELHLNPPHLGPLEVRLTVTNDQASALFVSAHSAVREAIETALPRLREMLADNGIMLGNVSVGAESFNQQQQAFDQKALAKAMATGSGGGIETTPALMGNSVSAGNGRDGMVDIFA